MVVKSGRRAAASTFNSTCNIPTLLTATVILELCQQVLNLGTQLPQTT